MNSERMAALDIVSVVGADVRLSRYGRRLVGLCPFHGERTPSMVVFPETATWKCFGCGEGGDVAAWVMKQHHLSFPEALARLGLDADGYRATSEARKLALPSQAEPPPIDWQRAAERWVRECARVLGAPEGAKALAWLTGPKRLLTERTIAEAEIGFNPEDQWVSAADWGMAGDGQIFLPAGVVIPCFLGDALWYVKVRRHHGAQSKYLMVHGSTPALFGADTVRDNLHVFWLEGEFDCLLLRQEAGHLVGTVTYGSASGVPPAHWLHSVLYADRVHGVYDNDQAGASGVARIGRELGGRFVRESVVLGKDVTEMASCWSLADWVESLIDPDFLGATKQQEVQI